MSNIEEGGFSMDIVFLVSGNGGNLKFIDICIKKGILNNMRLFVIGDRECGAIKYSRDRNISNWVVKYSKDSNTELANLLNELSPDIIITNFHRILDSDIVTRFYGKLINLHYSLLPVFKGMIGNKPILEAIDSGCKFIGCTVHYVDNDVDSGEIIIQGVLENKGSTEDIIDKVFKMGCLCLLNTILSKTSSCNHISYNKRCNNYWFNPKPIFDCKIFDKRFWEELKET